MVVPGNSHKQSQFFEFLTLEDSERSRLTAGWETDFAVLHGPLGRASDLLTMPATGAEWEMDRPCATDLPTLIVVKSSLCSDGKLLICKLESVQQTSGLIQNGALRWTSVRKEGLSLIGR